MMLKKGQCKMQRWKKHYFERSEMEDSRRYSHEIFENKGQVNMFKTKGYDYTG